MSDFVKYLAAIQSGDTTGLPAPKSNVEFYLAKLLGTYTGELPSHKSVSDVYLYQIAEQGLGGGGGDLPALAKPATAALILATYEAINKNGAKITGTMPNNGAVSERLTRSDTSYTVPAGYHDGNGKVYIDVQEKTVAPTSEAQEVIPDTGKLLSKVIVGASQGGGGSDFTITDASYLFYNNARESQVNEILPLVKAKKMSYMFSKNTLIFDNADFSLLDTSETEFFSGFFDSCANVALDLAAFIRNTTKAKDMSYMFKGCTSMCTYSNAPDLSGFDTSNVTNMSSMFDGCKNVKNLDVSGFDTGNVTNMSSMFANCTGLSNLDLSNFDTSNVTNMSNLFDVCSNLVSIVGLGGWDTGKVTNMNYMFRSCKKLEEIVGFSATNKAGMTIVFPYGTTSAPTALRRLVFRTDLPEGQYAIRSAISIKYCSFLREGIVEMFNSLPDVSDLGLSSSYTTITITGNVCLLDSFNVAADSGYGHYPSYEYLCQMASTRYRGLNYQDAPVSWTLDGGHVDGVFSDITPEMFADGSLPVKFLADTVTIPDDAKLTDADRAIATNKGWTLVE